MANGFFIVKDYNKVSVRLCQHQTRGAWVMIEILFCNLEQEEFNGRVLPQILQ